VGHQNVVVGVDAAALAVACYQPGPDIDASTLYKLTTMVVSQLLR